MTCSRARLDFGSLPVQPAKQQYSLLWYQAWHATPVHVALAFAMAIPDYRSILFLMARMHPDSIDGRDGYFSSAILSPCNVLVLSSL